MKTSRRPHTFVPLLAAAGLVAGCVSTSGTKSDNASDTSSKPAAAAVAPSGPKIGPGMNERGEVTDPKKVESGHGQTVKGLNDYDGEITGKPAPGTKFTKLQIGMSRKQVMDIVGTPTDEGAYVTGKAFIPFFYGGDRYRYEVVYKGQGRLIFAGSAGFDSNAHLIWIIHSAAEQGYR
ncbi:MAG: hypothetical protein M3Z29_06760 [Pseudomonadota bacterium]|nr:hypothetical protein [Pseudomonadota bacterium]